MATPDLSNSRVPGSETGKKTGITRTAFAVSGRPALIISAPVSCMSCLTLAEKQVAQDVLDGHANASIAARRHTSVSTVENQLHAIYRKLAISSRSELVACLLGGAGTSPTVAAGKQETAG